MGWYTYKCLKINRYGRKNMELEKLLTQKIKVNRSYRIDALKGIAIIAVVLYHFGGGVSNIRISWC